MPIAFLPRRQCPLCASSERETLCELDYADQPMAGFLHEFYAGRIPPGSLDGGCYRVVACKACGFIYQDAVLDEQGMQLLYHDWVDQAASLAKKQAAQHRLFRQFADQMQTLQRLFPHPPGQTRVLDFGMGWGYWVRMAQAYGFDACGIELSAHRRDHARAMGLTALSSLPADRNYDFIQANQVFEHLPDPVASLRDLTACLNPGGILSLRVPDGRGIRRRLAGQGWSGAMNAIHPLEHINCFTRGSLIQLGETAGLKPLTPPLRLQWGSIRSGIRREIADRWLSPHVLFTR